MRVANARLRLIGQSEARRRGVADGTRNKYVIGTLEFLQRKVGSDILGSGIDRIGGKLRAF